jgi:hypothetical protein
MGRKKSKEDIADPSSERRVYLATFQPDRQIVTEIANNTNEINYSREFIIEAQTTFK